MNHLHIRSQVATLILSMGCHVGFHETIFHCLLSHRSYYADRTALHQSASSDALLPDHNALYVLVSPSETCHLPARHLCDESYLGYDRRTDPMLPALDPSLDSLHRPTLGCTTTMYEIRQMESHRLEAIRRQSVLATDDLGDCKSRMLD